jgi:hypothetical protein
MTLKTIEKFWPLSCLVAVMILSYFFEYDIFCAASKYRWHLDALYGSVFNISAASSAFLFAFYTYVRTAEGAVLREIRSSKPFKTASQYIIRAIFASALLAIGSVPLTVIVPEPHQSNDRWAWIVCIWAAATAYVLALIVRSTYHFTAIMEAAFGDRLAPES